MNSAPWLTLSAPAKINLGLRVVGRREDGYHLLRSVMCFVPWLDRLQLRLAPEWVELHCRPEVTERQEENLVFRAAVALRRASGVTVGVDMVLDKVIPAAAGLGGGSSDAATALLGLNKLWGVDWPVERLARLGVTLGADIPFFLGQTAALAEGVGERLTPLPDFPAFPVALVNPGVPLATRDVFRQLPRTLTPVPSLPKLPPASPGELAALLVNDLEPVAVLLAPVVAEALTALREEGAVLAAMSGSGPTVYGIFPDLDQARAAARRLSARQPGWITLAGITGNHHPFAREWQAGVE